MGSTQDKKGIQKTHQTERRGGKLDIRLKEKQEQTPGLLRDCG